MCEPGKCIGGWVYLSVLVLVCILVWWCMGVAGDRDFG